jgi:hypothetical protein
MAKRKKSQTAEKTEPASEPQGNGVPATVSSKADAVRAAWATGLKKGKEIAEYVKSKFGLEVTPQYVSIIKSGDKKKGTKQKRAARGAHKQDGAGGIDQTIADLTALRSLVDRLGKDMVKKMLD